LNPHDTPDSAAGKKRFNVGFTGEREPISVGTSFTGDEASIEALTRAVGSGIDTTRKAKPVRSCHGDHVLTPQGKVAPVLLRDLLPSRDLRLGLVEASAEQDWLRRLMRCCCSAGRYDPQTGKYGVIIRHYPALGADDVLSIAGLITGAFQEPEDGQFVMIFAGCGIRHGAGWPRSGDLTIAIWRREAAFEWRRKVASTPAHYQR